MLQTITNFIIKRSEWLRGEGTMDSKLLRKSDQKRCCVGIYGRALGIPDEDIQDKGWPNMTGIIDHGCKWDVKDTDAEWLVSDAANANYLSTFNDAHIRENICAINPITGDAVDHLESEAQREQFIAAIFKGNGVTVTFED